MFSQCRKETTMQLRREAYRPPTANPGFDPERHRAHRRPTDPRRNRQRAGLQVRQCGRGAPAGAGAQGRHRARQRHLARHPPASGDALRPLNESRNNQYSPAAARHGAARASADRSRRRGFAHPGARARRPDLLRREHAVPAPARLPAQGARHVDARRRHHGRRPARGAGHQGSRATARSWSRGSATRSPSSASSATSR